MIELREMTSGEDEFPVDVSQDWMLACAVQQRFMQGLGRTSRSFDYSGHCRQARVLGGDCYDFTPLAEDRVALVVGDASGKGLSAALMIANVQSSLRTAALFTGDDPATLLKVVNHQAYSSLPDDRYTTLFYGVFDGSARTLRYGNAGHNPPLVVRADGSVDWLEAGGPPVGMFPDSTYEEKVVRLEPGDFVIAYTDGVTEATNPAGEAWGIQGLLRAAAGWAPKNSDDAEGLVRLILNSMDDFSLKCQSDDVTLAVLRAL